MPLNCWRPTAILLRMIAHAMDLLTDTPVEQLRQTIDGNLIRRNGEEPRTVQVLVREYLVLQDKGGVFVEVTVVRIVEMHVTWDVDPEVEDDLEEREDEEAEEAELLEDLWCL